MRIAYFLLIAIASLSSGCSALIVSSGKDLTVLETKEEVRAVLGEPTRCGIEDGRLFEEYRTRQKIVTPMWLGSGRRYLALLYLTCGASELGLTPIELYLTGTRTLLGQTIRINYGTTGWVTAHSLDGKSLYQCIKDHQ